MTGPQSAPQSGAPPAMQPPPGTTPSPPAATTSTSTSVAAPSFLAKMSRAERFMLGGAGLIVLTQLVFVMFGPYGFADIGWAAAVVTLLVIFFNSVAPSLSFQRETYTSLLVLLGAFMAILGVRELIDDVRFISSSRVDPIYYLGALGFYAGAVLMAFGASQLWRGKTP